MAITGRLISARAAFNEGTIDDITGCQLTYIIELHDDQLGIVGTRSFAVTETAIKENVRAYVEQMLPTIEAQTGIPITLPPANPSLIPTA